MQSANHAPTSNPLLDSVAGDAATTRRVRIPLVWQIAIGLVLGIVVGYYLNTHPAHKDWLVAEMLKPLGDIFIKLMKMIVVPIVFCSMVVGIAGSDESKSFGSMGTKAMVYFFGATTLAIIIGLVAANVFQPGVGLSDSQLIHAHASAPQLQSTESNVLKIALNIIPDNIVTALGEGKLLSIIFFAVMFGLALNRLPGEAKKPVVAMMRSVAEGMFRLTGLIMAYSPIGVFGMISVTIATFGFASLLPLAKLIAVVYLSLAIFAFVVLGSIAKYAGTNIFTLIRYFKDELILAFSSAASAAVMPQLMEKLKNFGVPPRIVSFVVPVGYAFNLDGASIFLGVATIFVAQLYGIDLSISQQIMLVVTMVLTSKGAAGVPGFALLILSATLASAGLPLEGVALVAGVFRMMEMGTTTLNVLGNAIAPIVVAKWDRNAKHEVESSTV
ncbi:cation:dicarboxylate symporter family transporter [Cupriavidus pauculus]|uniref:Sodium:dicarboxylate symporter n=1 Tax=Cupriavidus pauculus TaxID=82633 RepID=A0A2N5C3G7_9BURK|nr:cation:dicarboxylase symporter family transporter [Cupriavidus pauculus]PLP96773.1 sodium:dicarboxylate symporter [Cupriavidus pauculus]